MAWSWRLEKADGSAAACRRDLLHPGGRGELAGENWRGLRAEEVDKVTLLDGETIVYGMSLHDPE